MLLTSGIRFTMCDLILKETGIIDDENPINNTARRNLNRNRGTTPWPCVHL